VDSGLTGQKLIVDSYGGYARHSGGAMSSKDVSKVDRNGAHMTHYIAMDIVAAGVAEHCRVQLSYAIGLAVLMSILVETFCTGKMVDQEIQALLRFLVDQRSAAIIKGLT